jgi:diamine N-acetyltransferase
MSRSIYLRPLVLEDAQVSYAWRNNPVIWKYTGSKPDRYITPEIETAWLENVLKRPTEKRFAICLTDNDKYVGNIFLTDYENNEAQMHIFIGEMAYWGKGRAREAIELILEYGFEVLNLETMYSQINHKNLAALSLGQLAGFKPVADYYHEELKVMLKKIVYTREMYMMKKQEAIQ